MNFKFEWEIQFPNDDILEIVNEFQETDGVEPFDTFEEIPIELIMSSLEDAGIFEEIVYEDCSLSTCKITPID